MASGGHFEIGRHGKQKDILATVVKYTFYPVFKKFFLFLFLKVFYFFEKQSYGEIEGETRGKKREKAKKRDREMREWGLREDRERKSSSIGLMSKCLQS